MRTKINKVILLLIACILTPVSFSQQFNVSLIKETVEKELKEKSVPGVSIGIIKDDKLIYSESFGYANTTTKLKVNPDMLFRLGSTTKMFVAAAALLLVEQNKLDLNKPIKNYDSNFPSKIGSLTMQQLLTHTAGLFDSAPMNGPEDDGALEREIYSWTDDKIFLEPGRFFSYSNPGYWLAGYVIEAITYKPFADVMDEVLFNPLGMTNSVFRLEDANNFQLAAGHNKEMEVINPPSNHAGTYPSGSMFSTVKDISRFVIALMNNGIYEGKRILPETTVDKLLTSFVEVPDKEGTEYGFGIAFEKRRGFDYVFHNGTRNGYGSIIRIIPKENFALIILANRTGALMSITADVITEEFVNLEEEKHESYQSSYINNGEDFIGKFVCPEIAEIEFFEIGILHLKRGHHRVPIKKIGKNLYSDYIYPFTITRNNDGKVEYIHMEYHTLKRIE